MSKRKHLGSDFEDFLEEEGMLDESEAIAIKRVLAYQVQQEMLKHDLSKAAMARRMNTSRSSLDRLLDPENTSVTLSTMIRAASVMNKKLDISLSDINR